jgi:hypothetical protein
MLRSNIHCIEVVFNKIQKISHYYVISKNRLFAKNLKGFLREVYFF